MTPNGSEAKLQYGSLTESDGFPEILREHLPDVEFPFEGAFEGRMVQGSNSQLLYCHFKEEFPVEPHQHAAHFGILLCGQITLTIGDETKTLGPGDWYLVPADTMHEAHMTPGTKSVDIWFEPDRFKARQG